MKDKLNIEELLKQKFDSFEVDVNPAAWENIQKGMHASSVGSTIISAALKTGLIATGIVAASIVGVYFVYPTTTAIEVVPVVTKHQDIPVYDDVHTDFTLIESVESVHQQNELDVKTALPDNDKNSTNNLSTAVISNGNKTTNSNVNTPPKTDVNTNTDGQTKDAGNDGSIPKNTKSIEKTVVDKKDTKEVNEQPVSGRLTYSCSSFTAPATINFESNAFNFTAVRWDFGDGKIGDGEKCSHIYERPGKYEVKMFVYNQNEIYEEVKLIQINTKSSIDNPPNIITPNGDRINDYFSVNTVEIKSFYVAIMDEKGNLIFESEDPNFKWDGTGKDGSLQEKGIYTYMIIAEGNDGDIFKIPGPIYIK